MVKVRLLRKWYTHKPGETVEVSESMARQLIFDRFAESLPKSGRTPNRTKTKTPEAAKG